ncbi:MAG: hypothetical protein HEQ22_04830 [Sphingopyxis sp.]|uniref:hypothetical protein n=1 Tax=Sphingopyxis sp. TaxID=1908224 RepID=UPI003D81104A
MSTEELVPNSVAATMAVSNAAFAALWPVLKRQNADETVGYSEFLQWRAHFVFMRFRARHLDRILIKKCHDLLKYDDLFDDERKDLLNVIDMFDAIRNRPGLRDE